MATQDNDKAKAEAIAPELSEDVVTFESQVNTVVSAMKSDERGNYQLPPGEYSDEVKYAANAERRRRSTESALAKTRQELKAQAQVSQKLSEKMASTVPVTMTQEQAQTLNEMKFEDPDRWRLEMNKLDTQASSAVQSEIQTITSEASQQAEINARQISLSEFNAKHTKVQITDEIVKNDIPPRITNKLANGEITFDDFLVESYAYLTSGKVILGTLSDPPTNLSSTGGGSTPSAAKINTDKIDYKNQVF